MKLEDAVVILVCCSCLAKVNIGVDETQATAMSTITLTSSIDKSGRQAVCWNETIVYQCRSVDHLTWNVEIDPQNSITFLANESKCVDRGRFFAQNNPTADNYLLSYLTIPYNPELEMNGTAVNCTHGPSVYKELLYVITGSPTPPSSIWYNATKQHVTLHWDTNTTCGMDCHMTMITVDDDIMLNTSYQAGAAVIDISKYHSNNSIAVKMYGINRCGMVSTNYTEKMVELHVGGNSSIHCTGVCTGVCVDPHEIAIISITIPPIVLLIGIAAGVFCGVRCCRKSC